MVPYILPRGPNRGGNKEELYISHIKHLVLHVVLKTRKIILNIVGLLRENNTL